MRSIFPAAVFSKLNPVISQLTNAGGIGREIDSIGCNKLIEPFDGI